MPGKTEAVHPTGHNPGTTEIEEHIEELEQKIRDTPGQELNRAYKCGYLAAQRDIRKALGLYEPIGPEV